MKKGPARARPILKFDAQFEGGAGLANEVDLIDPQRGVEGPQRGQRCFPNADRSNLRRLDQNNLLNAPAKQHAQRGGGHPPRAAAADDHYATQSRAWHPSIKPPFHTGRKRTRPYNVTRNCAEYLRPLSYHAKVDQPMCCCCNSLYSESVRLRTSKPTVIWEVIL